MNSHKETLIGLIPHGKWLHRPLLVEYLNLNNHKYNKFSLLCLALSYQD